MELFTTPFFMEGSTRYNNAVRGIKKLEKHVDTLIVIPNEKLLEIAPNLPLQTAFKLADEVLTNAVKGITELVTVNGLVNLDFADVKNIMSEAGLSVIGLGESNTENKAEECVEKALHNPLLDVDLNDATGALINVVGGNDLTLEEARQVVTKISTHLSDDAKIIWGAQIMPDLNKTIKTMVVVTGVKSEQILSKKRIDDLHDAEYDDDLGIENVIK